MRGGLSLGSGVVSTKRGHQSRRGIEMEFHNFRDGTTLNSGMQFSTPCNADAPVRIPATPRIYSDRIPRFACNSHPIRYADARAILS